MKLFNKGSFITAFLFKLLIGYSTQILCDKNQNCSECSICGLNTRNYCSCNFSHAFCKNEGYKNYTFLPNFLYNYDSCNLNNKLNADGCGDNELNIDIGKNYTIKISSNDNDNNNNYCFYTIQKTTSNNNNLDIMIKNEGTKYIELNLYLVLYLTNNNIKIASISNIFGKSNIYNLVESEVEKVSLYAEFPNSKTLNKVSLDFFVEANYTTKISHTKDSDNKSTKILIILGSIMGVIILVVIILFIKRFACNKPKEQSSEITNNIDMNKKNLYLTQLKQNKEKMEALYSKELAPKIFYKNKVLNEGYKCTICQEEFIEGKSLITITECNHGFHLKCFQDWVTKNLIFPKCPNCNKPILNVENTFIQNNIINTNPSFISGSNTQVNQTTTQTTGNVLLTFGSSNY